MTTPDPLSAGSGGSDQTPITERLQHWYRGLPDKKRYLELVTAALSVPVLLTVLISNVNSLKNQNKPAVSPTPTVSATPSVTVIQHPAAAAVAPVTESSPSATPTPGGQCRPDIGPVVIADPKEGDEVSGDPVCITVTGTGAPYCAVVWSYRINGSAWSSYTGNAICMYGLPAGNKTLDLRVKSTVTGDETMITRRFTVAGTTPDPTPASSSAATN